MRCPRCDEDVFEDATICRFCGAVLPGMITGATQRLSLDMLRPCPKCNGIMSPGSILAEAYRSNLWWIAASPEDYTKQIIVDGRSYPAIPVTSYRCGSCGYLESYTAPDMQSHSE